MEKVRFLLVCTFVFFLTQKESISQDDVRFDQLSIKELHSITGDRAGKPLMYIGDQVEFKIDNLDSARLDPNQIYLYIDGFRLPTNRALSSDQGRVIFELYESDTLKSVLWQSINSWGVHSRKVRLSLGNSDGNHIHVRESNMTIDFDPNYTFRSWLGRVIIILIVAAFFVLAKKPFFLKAPGSDKYSLSRSQLGWWTMIVICSYVALWSDSGLLVPLSSDTLILIGISAGTAATAQTIDKSKQSNQPAPAPAPVEGPPPKKDRFNFFENILSDGSGISIHRFQGVVFTFFIGIFFIYEVIASFEMPDLDPGILGLMGISSATYAGLKTNESHHPGTTPETPPENPPQQ